MAVSPIRIRVMTILLTTLNARYTHASLGLRYLLANMGELQEQTALQEFVLGAKTTEVVERILAHQPKIVGFGIYIWNVEETTKVVAMLKRVAPQVVWYWADRRYRTSRANSRSSSWPI